MRRARYRAALAACGLIVYLGLSSQMALAASRVMVPQVGRTLISAYAALHRAGLRVSMAASVIGPDRVPMVVRVVPRAGSRVPRGSVVRLVLGPPRGRAGRPHGAVIPAWPGVLAGVAAAWAQRVGVGLTLHLGPLRAVSAGSLLANYVIVQQLPMPGSRSRSASIWAVQTAPVRHGRCILPWNAQLYGSDGQAVVASVTTGQTEIWYGCATQSGAIRILGVDAWNESVGGTGVGPVTLAGTEVALGLETLGGKYAPGLCDETVTVIDLTTGHANNNLYTAGCGTIDSLVVDASGFVAWRAISTIPTFTALSDIACPAVSLCVAVDAAGRVATSGDPTGGRGAWTFASGAGGDSGIACPTVSLCVTVGGDSVSTSSNPSGGASAWTAGTLPGATLFDISCPSVSLCVAVGGDTIATSTDPGGGSGAWTVTQLNGQHDLMGVSCPSASLCVAADSAYGGDVLTTTNPTGGVSGWTATQVDKAASFVDGISCPTARLCLATDAEGHVVTSTDPTSGPAAWTVANINGGFLSRPDCPTTELCVTASLNGLAWSDNPTGGPSAWSEGAIVNGGGFVGVACPSTTLCVAVSNTGYIATTTSPTSGIGAWNSALVDSPDCAINTTCSNVQLYAHDDNGTRVLDSAGPGDANAISGIDLNGDELPWTANGVTRRATLG